MGCGIKTPSAALGTIGSNRLQVGTKMFQTDEKITQERDLLICKPLSPSNYCSIWVSLQKTKFSYRIIS